MAGHKQTSRTGSAAEPAAASIVTIAFAPAVYVVGSGIVTAMPGTADTVAFTTFSGTLSDSAAAVMLNAIQDFRLGDGIDLTQGGYVAGKTTVADVAGQPGAIEINGLSSGSATLNFVNSGLTASDFTVSGDGGGGTLLRLSPAAPLSYWLNQGSGVWSDTGGWLDGQIPNRSDIVSILGTYSPIPLSLAVAQGQAATVVLDVPNSNLIVTGGLTVAGTVTVAQGALSVLPGATLVAANLRMEPYTGLTLGVRALMVLTTGNNPESEPGVPALEADWSATLTGATLSAPFGSVLIGSNAAQTQGQVTATNASVIADLTALGNNPRAIGSLTIDGGSWTDAGNGTSTLSGDMIVGDSGQGALTITNGGVLRDTRNALFGAPQFGAVGSGGVASALVTAGGRWMIAGNMAGNATADSLGAALLTVGASGGRAGTVAVGGLATGMTVDIEGGTFSATSVADSTFTMTGGVLTGGTVQNAVTLTLAGSAMARFAVTDAGSITLDATSSVTIGSGVAKAGTLLVAAGNSATLDGGIAAPTLDVEGALTGGSSALTYAGAITGAGTLAPAGDIALSPSALFGNTIVLSDLSTLTLSDGSLYDGTIDATWQFVSADEASTTVYADLPNLAFGTANGLWDASVGVASLGTLAPFTFAAPGLAVTATSWSLSDDGNGGSLITFTAVAACYVAGTAIATPDGPRDVAQLRPGDAVLALRDGAWSVQPVRWIGQFTALAGPGRESVAPVLIRAGAVADGLPARDLYVSPDHALWIGGALVPARLLVNGATIVRDRTIRPVRYLHVELDRHALLLAEGLAAESYLDTGNRGQFTAEWGVRPMTAARDAGPALGPPIQGGAPLAALRAALRARALGLGWRWRRDPAPLVLADGQPLALSRRARLGWRGRVPPGARRLTLISRHFVPADLDPAATDRRRLGLAVVDLTLGGAALPGRNAGWHAAEPHWRWTDGAASVALPGMGGVLGLRCADAAPGYWAQPVEAQPVAARASDGG